VRLAARITLIAPVALALVRTAAAASTMAQSMEMNDASQLGMLWLDQLEWRGVNEPNGAAWQGEGWYGGDYDKAWVRSEGESYSGRGEDARAELFWDHAIARWWNLEVGGRQDFGTGPARTWAALGVRGTAPEGVDVEATVYAGDAGRTAARLKLEYELLFTQRLVLQPELEMNLYGRADPARDIGAGVADLEIGLRLRYEVRREFAPYAGLVWVRHYGASGNSLGAAGADQNELSLAVGLRLWL
jgi:copper resistance protein B